MKKTILKNIMPIVSAIIAICISKLVPDGLTAYGTKFWIPFLIILLVVFVIINIISLINKKSVYQIK
ncbi:hypothetical protein AGR56_11065 [Clostridium sp. DMHC 10]|uniref:hypothetical protein n=1 Tax=Clostridium sp. DMHC 10 TaxID=747377 RepID=UPI00069EE9E7|nr:hypothetical protein [Clostridium sp. DMHC 10]KOF57080.1 hypothetical protein AGR56_11065 [Clostridium sp. DMHC 10]